MNLLEMREIASKRTALRWIKTEKHIMNADCYPIADFNVESDAEFMTMAANTFDKLLDVVEAAKTVNYTMHLKFLTEVLEALEGPK